MGISDFVGFSVTILVNGLMISGEVTSETAWSSRLDEAIEEALTRAEERYRRTEEGGEVPGHFAAVAKAIRGNTFSEEAQRRYDESDTLRREVEEATGGTADWRIADLPEDLARRFIQWRTDRCALTLANAVVKAPVAPPVELGTIRVHLAHVAAWWPGRPVLEG